MRAFDRVNMRSNTRFDRPLRPHLLDGEFIAEGEFAGVHLSGVGFVIVAAEVEKAMENELFYLEFEREAGGGGLSGGLLGGDDDIA